MKIMKIFSRLLLLIILTAFKIFAKDPENIEILGIEPNSGLISGDTRVQVRLKDFDTELIDDYPHPMVIVYIFKILVSLWKS